MVIFSLRFPIRDNHSGNDLSHDFDAFIVTCQSQALKQLIRGCGYSISTYVYLSARFSCTRKSYHTEIDKAERSQVKAPVCRLEVDKKAEDRSCVRMGRPAAMHLPSILFSSFSSSTIWSDQTSPNLLDFCDLV